MSGKLIQIDGSHGEGGGQILRTSASLAAALGKAVRVTNIRANRPQKGLRPQHLAAMRAVAEICRGQLEGAEVGSSCIELHPGEIIPGEYHFDIGTAGSANLVLQTILPPLLMAQGDSSVTVRGGTHNPMAPCFEYVRDVYGPLLAMVGVQAFFQMVRPGFYPAGGGELRMELAGFGGREPLIGLKLCQRGELKSVEGLSAISDRLPEHILERQASQLLGRLRQARMRGSVEQARWSTYSPGTAVFLRALCGQCVGGFSALGKRGKPAEAVADEAFDAMQAYLSSPGALDCHAADQVLVVLALALEPSEYTTNCVTEHLLTNAEIVRQLTGRAIDVEGRVGECGRVILHGQ